MGTPIVIVQGGQWGSEAKGAIAAFLCKDRGIDYAVRTGAINAGHTVVYGGKKFAMQQIPTGWVNPNTALVIGAGGYIHPETLWHEIDMINAAMPGQDVRERLWIDFRCGLHTEEHEAASKEANRHHRIGATGKGCSEAIVSKIRNRNNGYQLFAQSDHGRHAVRRNNIQFTDTALMLNRAYDSGKRILIEGTQGTHLDLHLGPYPFTTSRMTSAANWIAEAGLSPALDYEVVLVCRTYPIRVAGNSGPMMEEIEWLDLARHINSKLRADGLPARVSEKALDEFDAAIRLAATRAVMEDRYPFPISDGIPHARMSGWSASERERYRVAASELHREALQALHPDTVTELKKLFEMTTVTKKLRRIANLHIPDLRRATVMNRPDWIALTFLDYVEPALAGLTYDDITSRSTEEGGEVIDMAVLRAMEYIQSLTNVLGVPIGLVSTGAEEGCIMPPVHLKFERSVR